MAFKDYLTVDGERLLALAASGTKITFTRMVMGSGYLPEGTYERNISEVINPEKELDLQAVRINDNSTVLIQFYFSNEKLEQGFYYREKAIYATDGKKEVLAVYGNAKDKAEYIDTPDIVLVEKKIKTILQLTSEEIENITLSNATNAQAPLSRDIDLCEFVESYEAKSLDVGQVVILNKVPYTYVGDDCNDVDCYVQGGFGTLRDIVEAAFYSTYNYVAGLEVDEEEIILTYDVEEAFYAAFTGAGENDSTALSAADINLAIATQWNGESSSDITALSANDVNDAINTQWSGESTTDPTALSSVEIDSATQLR